MKWFKHMTDASNDETVVLIEDQFGLEGYARWFKLLEIVASQMDKTNRCSVAYPWSKWQTFLKGKRKKLETFLECLENENLIFLKENENILEISIPNLATVRDNHTRNLQAANKLLASDLEVTGKQEVEVEEDKNNTPPTPPQGGEVSLPENSPTEKKAKRSWSWSNVSPDRQQQCRRVITHLNETTGSSFNEETKVAVEGLLARLDENVLVSDCLLAIDYLWALWGDDAKMRNYVRPSTIFRPKNFPNYLSQAKRWEKEGKPSLSDNSQHRSNDDHLRRKEETSARIRERAGF